MKLFTRPALLAAAFLSALLVLPFLPAGKARPLFFALEARMTSSVAGVAKVYYDLGTGFNEVDSSQDALVQTATPRVFRFPFAPGTYRALRFDPIDGPGTVTFAGPLRIVSRTGRVLHTFAPSELEPVQQIESRRETAGGLEMVMRAEADDPQLSIVFASPLQLAISLREHIEVTLGPFLALFSALSLVLLAFDRSPSLRTRAARAAGWLQQRPQRAVALVAAAAVAVSAYPVVFLGKSYVSPNFATTLLYGTYPTLPGYTSSVTATGNGSDMGATMWQHVPYSFIQHRALAGGEWPLWNRYNSTGTPLLAQGQSMLGDPLHALVVLADGAAWAWDIKFLAAKWLLATGLGWSVLALLAAGNPLRLAILGEGPPVLRAALMVTLAAPFLGFFHYRINHGAIFSLSYAPWVLYGWLRLASASGRRPIAGWTAGLWVANFALMNSGTVKEAYLLLAQMNLVGACLLLVHREAWRARLIKLAAAAWAGALLVLITAPVWATFLQALRHAYTVSMNTQPSQLQPALLLGAFDELFFRPLNSGVVFDPSLNFLLLLGMLFFLATLRLHFSQAPLMVVALGAAGTLAFAFGVVPPRWILRVPLLANVGHIENCFLCGFIVLGSLLAGAGFATAMQRLRQPEGRNDLIIAGTLLCALVCAWIGFNQATHRDLVARTPLSGPALGDTLVIGPFIWGSLAAMVAASLGLAMVLRRGVTGPASVILAVTCGVVLLWRHGLQVAAVGPASFTVQPPVRANFHAGSPAVEFLRAAHAAEPGRVYGLHNNLTPGWNAVYGLEAMQGPDALVNPWLRQLLDVSPLAWVSSWQLYSGIGDAERARPFLDALNVRHYLDLKSNHGLQSGVLQLAHRADLNVYESPTAWPRAFFTTRLETYQDAGDLMKRFLGRHDGPFASVPPEELAQRPGLQRLAADTAAAQVTPATGYRLTENTTAFDVHASAPGLAVLTEAWWPDAFRASVDGRRVPIVRVNHAFQGVVIETAGDHRVRFWYWPRNFLRQLELSGGGVVLLALSLFFGLRRRPPFGLRRRPTRPA